MRRTKQPGSRGNGAGTRRFFPWRALRVFLVNALAALIVFHAAVVLSLFAMRTIDPPVTALQIQRRIEALVTFSDYRPVRTPVPIERISRHLIHAVVAAEDGGFFAHGGIDWEELQNAVEENERRKRWRGGSTITQQLVKNLYFGTRLRWLTKPFDYTVAPLADGILGKARVLAIYLNIVEWGPGVYGAEAACRHWYDRPAAGIGRERAARLAAILPAPRHRHPDRMNRYSRIILTRMAGRGW